MLMMAVMDKVGTFGMLRYCLQLFPDASTYFRPLIVVLSVIGVVYGAIVAIGQTDIMRLIAYTSISHFGFIILGIFVMTTQGQSGSTLYMVNHGLSTAAVFLIAGFLIARGGTRSIADYGGVQKVAPVLAGTFLVAALATLSLPGWHRSSVNSWCCWVLLTAIGWRRHSRPPRWCFRRSTCCGCTSG
ncbi:NADH-Ubiquinone/plastoquinone (complex I), various chains family protein [Mycobacterium xenopi 4042]|uniref:NADH-Ubiquinone/plastoquinone (Complex I), various chains family protein n=1 Tax=Mycobacterium xenopi 4042 TaxID=1299334 RepID=X7Z2Y0_MYCXE|nr:NADH-Ubiquinone/plastoquinone (complex I), various chains family protein [Mycobacterium xenopi 4042]